MAGLKACDMDVRMGERLQKLRIECKLTQREVAKAMGVSGAQLQKYEKGINCLSATALYRAAVFMGVSPLVLMDPLPQQPDPAQSQAVRDALDRAREIVAILDGA